MIGNGNVAADIIRLLLARQDNSDDVEMHPLFQERVRKQGPRFIRNFARGSVLQCKITLKELESFEKNGISVYASFDEHGINEAELSDEQRQKLEFFRRAKNKSLALTDGPRVHFHFGCSPVRAYRVGRNILEIEIRHDNGKVERYRPSDIITAIGRDSPTEELLTPFVAGWASGHGGNLSIIQKTVAENTARILALDEKRYFDHQMGPAPEQPWQLKASVTNQGLLNILAYRKQEGVQLNTAADWRKARDYTPTMGAPVVAEEEAAAELSTQPVIPSIAGTLMVQHQESKESVAVKLAGRGSATVYRLLKDASKEATGVPVPENECNESGNCMRCIATVESPQKPVEQKPLERSQLRTLFGRKGKNMLLTCQHDGDSTAKLGGKLVIQHPTRRVH